MLALASAVVVALVAAQPSWSAGRPTRTYSGPLAFSWRNATIATKPQGGTTSGDLYVDGDRKRVRLDRHAAPGRPATSAWVFYDKNRVYVFSDGACRIDDLTAVSSIIPMLGETFVADFWDPYGNLGALTRVTNRRIPYWIEGPGGVLELAGRKRVGIWRQAFRGGVIELGFADGDPTDRPYSATWRSNGRGMKLSGGAFSDVPPAASVYSLPPECVG